jgi:high-affinity nickel-transport protein
MIRAPIGWASMSSATQTAARSTVREGAVATRFDRADWTTIATMGGVVLALHLFGWGVLVFGVAPQHITLGSAGVFGVGLGVTAYLLGVRHAFDADHIAVIDNTTRKLVGEGTRSLSAGFWFSLGHSSVVFGLAFLLAIGVRAVVGPVQDEGSPMLQTLGLIGSLVAGTFLILIGLSNLFAAVGIAKVYRRMRSGDFDEAELERHLEQRGFLARIFAKTMRRVNKPWHLYPVGLLMGLGFDTASQVALLVLAAGTAAFTLPWYAILVLPVLFAAGMSLFDALDGILMSRAYGWAFLKPVRKVYYNLTITGLSIAVAVFIGGLEVAQVLSGQLGLTGGFWDYANRFDINHAGYVIVGMFVVIWLVALGIWRYGRVEARWEAAAARARQRADEA